MSIYSDICTEEEPRLCEQQNIVALSKCLQAARIDGDRFLLSSRDAVFAPFNGQRGDRAKPDACTAVGKSLGVAEKAVSEYENGKVCRFVTLTSDLTIPVRSILSHDFEGSVDESLCKVPIRIMDASLADAWLGYLIDNWDRCPKYINVAIAYEIEIAELIYLLRGDCDDLRFSTDGESFGLLPHKGAMFSEAKILAERAPEVSDYNARLVRKFFARCACSIPA